MLDAIRAVLFDLDDTLTDRAASLAQYVPLFLEAFRARLQPIDASALVSALSSVDRQGYNTQRSQDAAQLPIWRSAPSPRELDAHWLQHFAACAAPRRDALRTLRALRGAGLRLAVVTNGLSVSQRTKLQVMGVTERVDVIVVSEEVSVKKPALRIFAHALDGLSGLSGLSGLTPRECLFVGDNPYNDIVGASDFGMHAAWLATSVTWPADLPAPRYQLAALAEVLRLLGVDDATGPGASA
jgi:putative hydrolase of the HAD superfamily